MFMGFGLAAGFLVSLLGVGLTGFAILYALFGTPAHWVVGTRMNAGHDRHRLGAAPVQYWAIWYPIIAGVVFCVVLAMNGHKGWAIVLGVAGFIALLCFGFWASVDARLAHPSPRSTTGPSRKALAAVQNWRYEDRPGREVFERWSGAYPIGLRLLEARRLLAGDVHGVPFTVFDLRINVGSLAQRRESERTVCLAHLPVALPDLRLRPRLPDDMEEPMSVADEPPWNCDLIPRIRGVTMIAQNDPQLQLIAEADVPGLAPALATEAVRHETLRQRLPGWRIHGRDLIYVSLPAQLMSTEEAMTVVTGLVAIARLIPVPNVQT
jgi:hypothetical protein